MCMLYGFTSKNKFNLGPTLQEFFRESVYHPDGWGIGFYEKTAKVIKAPYKAINSPQIRKICNLHSNLCIAHIRRATIGERNVQNTHPFKESINGKEWIFAHNGTVSEKAFQGLKLKPIGSTDSEKCFMYIKQQLECGDDEVETIEKAVRHLAKYGKFNMLLTDGESMYVHANMEGTLYQYNRDGLVCIVTKSLFNVKDSRRWSKVSINRLIVFKNGEISYLGKKHNFEYKLLTKKYFAN